MAISAYTGVPGSGKSYALVSEVILPALAAGRRVVSNIDGLKPQAFSDYIAKKGGTMGELVQFDGADTISGRFWPVEGATGESVLRAGDLLVMDEARLYWPPRGKFPEFITKFLRYHRHWIAENGTSTDIVLASQVLTDFHLDIRGLFERTYKFKKLSTVGLSKRYVWNMWEGQRQNAREVAGRGGGSYRPEIFELYSSYKGGGAGQSVSTDKRANVLRNPKLWFLAAGSIAALITCAFVLSDFFSPRGVDAETRELAAVASASDPHRNPYGASGPASLPQVVPGAVRGGGLLLSQEWRIAGLIDGPQGRRVVLADRRGAVRLESPSLFFFDEGEPVSGVIDGQRVVASLSVVGAGEAPQGLVDVPQG